MANADRAGSVRHTHETNALNYGHFGTATYETDTHDWTFLRKLQDEHHGREDDSDDDLDEGEYQLIHESVWRHHKSAGNDEVQVEDHVTLHPGNNSNILLKHVPEAAAASLELPAVRPASSNYDEPWSRSSGSLVAFVSAEPPLEARTNQNTPHYHFAAFPTNKGGEKVRLAPLDAEDILVRDRSGSESACRVPCLDDRASVSWGSSAERIRHVSCSRSPTRTRLLVVQSGGTSILRLTMRNVGPSEHNYPGGFGRTLNGAQAIFDPHLILTIPSSRTGESPHAHAAFDPHSRNAIAIVDVRGVWSVWRIKDRRQWSARVLNHAHVRCSGDLGDIGIRSLSNDRQRYFDGWHRICWLTNERQSQDVKDSSNGVLVCNRRFAAVFDLKGGFVCRIDMRLGLKSDANQILEVKSSDRCPSLIFVLTTSRLMIFSSSEHRGKEDDEAEPLTLLCSWNHYRDRNDLSLRMSTLEFSQGTWILLYSWTNPLAVLYRFEHGPSPSNIVSARDPSIFPMPRQLQEPTCLIHDIVLHPVDFLATRIPTDKPQFGLFKLIAYTNDGTVINATYRHNLDRLGDRNGPGLVLKPSLPAMMRDQFLSAKFVDKEDMDEDGDSDDDELDDFVVADGIDEESLHSDDDALSSARNGYMDHPLRSRDWHRLLDYEILQFDQHSAPSFDVLLTAAVDEFEGLQLQPGFPKIQLISDLVDQLQAIDVEQDSESAGSWLRSMAERDDVFVESVDFRTDMPSVSSHPSLLELYDYYFVSYIGALGSRLPDRNRVNREKLVRQVIADAFLGSLILRPSGTVDMASSAGPGEATTQPTEMASSPPDSGRESQLPSSSQPASSQSPLSEEDPVMRRLGAYAAFRPSVPPLSASPNVLAHIPDSIEDDPRDYSYQSVHQKLRLAQEEMAALSLDPRERRKAERQAARLQRKLDQKAKMSQEVIRQRELLPSVNTSLGRGMSLPGREIQSSQMAMPASSQGPSQSQAGIPMLNMTQPERGVYGTRSLKTKGKSKGPKRKPGF